MKKTFKFVLGALLIAAGVIYALSELGICDIHVSCDGWWAFFIIIPCLEGVFCGNDKIRSLIGAAFGVALLLAAQDVIEFALIWKLMIPAIIILIGIKMIVRDARPKAETKTDKGGMAAFCEKEVDYDGEELTLGKIGAVFGGTKCNLTDARITDGAQIDVLCIFGGADIIVPSHVNVKVNTFCLFGGVSDKRVIKEPQEKTVTLNINGFCLFGGADIK